MLERLPPATSLPSCSVVRVKRQLRCKTATHRELLNWDTSHLQPLHVRNNYQWSAHAASMNNDVQSEFFMT